MDTRHAFEQYLTTWYRDHTRQSAFHGHTAADFAAWQPAARRRFRRLLGLPRRDRTPLNLRREPHSETAAWTRERVYYDVLPGVTVPAWLLIPKNVPLPAPAVLCPPGHGGGMNQVLDEAPGIYKQYPLDLVRRGLVALVPEHLGFGERLGEAGHDQRASHAYYIAALNLFGMSYQGLMIADLMVALDVLAALPEVKRGHLGCYGLSLGGETTLLLTAADPRVRAACISGFFCSYQSSFLDQTHCACGYSYGLLREFEHLDLGALIAPRPLLLESATRDPIFPIATAQASYRELRQVYELLGAPERLAQDVFEGEHEISGTLAFSWLERWLR